MSAPVATHSSIATRGLWFGPADRPALGWLTEPGTSRSTSGVVIAPPIGYPYWSSHRTLRVLSDTLAGSGHRVLRFDYDGTGDSAGDQWDPDRLDAWRASLRFAVEELRAAGAASLTVFGVQFGATLALLDARDLAVDRVVAWQPVATGRRFVRQLKLLSNEIPPEEDPLEPRGTRVFAGTVLSAETLRALEALKVGDMTDATGLRVLVLDDPATGEGTLVEHLRSIGAVVDHETVEGGETALHTPPELGSVPPKVIPVTREWLGVPDAEPPPRGVADAGLAVPPSRARFRWGSVRVEEEVVRLARTGHMGVMTTPAERPSRGATLVFLNPGSETHVGPGRAWVELARGLAASGRRTVRVDFIGWGESPDGERAPGRPYDQNGIDDVGVIVRELRASGHERVVVCGLCASAWIALRAALTAPVAGVIVFNPQLYWTPGDPVEIDWDLIRARRRREISSIERGARWGVWSALDTLGHRSEAGRWLDRLADREIPIELLFADGDDGKVYLDGRLRRRVQRVTKRGSITVRELPGIDHPLHRSWLRHRVIAALEQALARIDATLPSADPRGSGAAEHPAGARPQLPAVDLTVAELPVQGFAGMGGVQDRVGRPRPPGPV